MSQLYLIDASHRLDLLLLHLQLGLPQKVGTCHIFTLAIQGMQHSNHQQQQQEAFDLQREASSEKSRLSSNLSQLYLARTHPLL